MHKIFTSTCFGYREQPSSGGIISQTRYRVSKHSTVVVGKRYVVHIQTLNYEYVIVINKKVKIIKISTVF